jgi:hypothetical protein
VNISRLSPHELERRLKTIYELEKKRDATAVRLEVSKKATAAARRAFGRAQAALDKEVDDQRHGPGPLYDPTTLGKPDQK